MGSQSKPQPCFHLAAVTEQAPPCPGLPCRTLARPCPPFLTDSPHPLVVLLSSCAPVHPQVQLSSPVQSPGPLNHTTPHVPHPSQLHPPRLEAVSCPPTPDPVQPRYLFATPTKLDIIRSRRHNGRDRLPHWHRQPVSLLRLAALPSCAPRACLAIMTPVAEQQIGPLSLALVTR